MIMFEAAPYMYTDGNENIKKELYLQSFDVFKFGNLKGERPIKHFGFFESDNAYLERLEKWENLEKNVLFTEWTCNDLNYIQIFTRKKDNTSITFNHTDYTIMTGGQEFKFPILPQTIDDLINDFKRVGIKLFWNDAVVEKFGYHEITASRKIIEYYEIIKEVKNTIE